MEADWKVLGRVQGVSLRAYCAQTARQLALGGWVRNEPDGSVRLHLSGPAQAIEKMRAALRSLHRPWGADVERIEEVQNPKDEGAGSAPSEFAILD